MERCINCGSGELRFVENYGPTGVVAPDGGAEYSYETGVECEECGCLEDFGIEIPELDDLDDMLAYFADAPTGEPPELQYGERKSPRISPAPQRRRKGVAA